MCITNHPRAIPCRQVGRNAATIGTGKNFPTATTAAAAILLLPIVEPSPRKVRADKEEDEKAVVALVETIVRGVTMMM